VKTLIKESLLVKDKKREIHEFEGITPTNLRLISLDAGDEEVIRAMQESLGTAARALSVRRVTCQYGDNYYPSSVAVCKIKGNVVNTLSIIKLGTSLIKVYRSDTRYKCHIIGHIANLCSLNEVKNPT
jgi:hypothetical protein